MAITQAKAIEDVRARLDEENASVGFLVDSQIRTWLNEGVKEVARRSLWKRSSSNVPVSAGTQYYTAPAAAIQIYRVEYLPNGTSNSYALEYRDINAMDVVWGAGQNTGRGIVEIYTLVSANPLSIELHPTPSQSGNIKVYYYAMPTDLATSSTADASTSLDVPTGWEDLPVEWATALAFRKARDINSYQLAIGSFGSTIARLTEIATRYTDEPTFWTGQAGYDYW